MSKKRNRHGQAGPPAKKHKSHSTKLRNPHVHVPKSLPLPSPTTQSKKPTPNNRNLIQAHNQPTIPFSNGDRILLVGEGDFSYALSLVRHHSKRIGALCATCFDSREELLEKYEQAEGYIDEILRTQEVGDDVDHGLVDDESAYNTDDEAQVEDDADGLEEKDYSSAAMSRSAPLQTKVLYGIDATKLHTYKAFKKDKQGFTRIVFNFPHVGGKSTDVNRQVRYNQALLHDFFVSAKELLTSRDKPKVKEYDGEKTGANDIPVGERRKKRGKTTMEKEEKKVDPTLLVTLFESTPYTLWNIKDLARSAGLKVLRSWAFKSEVYPGYEHARTLGNIKSKGDTQRGHAGSPENGGRTPEENEDEEEAEEEVEDEDDGWTGFSEHEETQQPYSEIELPGLDPSLTPGKPMKFTPTQLAWVQSLSELPDTEVDPTAIEPHTPPNPEPAHLSVGQAPYTPPSTPPQQQPARIAVSEEEAQTQKVDSSKAETASNSDIKRPGKWRGEERAARTYEFGLVDQAMPKNGNVGKAATEHDNDEFEKFKKKRKRKGGKLFDEEASSDGEK